MAIRISCPSCEEGYAVNDDLAGKKIRCRNCKEVIAVPAATKAGSSEGGGVLKKKADAVSPAPKPKRVPAETNDDDDDMDDRPRRKAEASRNRDDYDDDDEDDRPRRKPAAKKSGMMLPLLIGGGVLGMLACGGVGTTAYILLLSGKGDKGNVAVAAAGLQKDNPPIQKEVFPPIANPENPPVAAPKKEEANPFKLAPVTKQPPVAPPVKQEGDNPFKQVTAADTGKVIVPDWSGTRNADMVPANSDWKIAGAPAAPLAFKPTPVGLPARRHFFEGCNALVVNPVARRGIVSYQWGDKGKTTSRFLFCDIENGKIISQFIVEGQLVPLAINDEGTMGLFKRDPKSKGKKDKVSKEAALEMWSLSDKGGERVLEFNPSEGKGADIRMAVFLDSKRLLTAEYGPGKVVVWELPTMKPIYKAQIQTSSLPALSPDRKLLAFVTGGQIGVLDVDAGKVLAMQPTNKATFFASLSFSPGAKKIACAVTDRVLIWDVATGALQHEIPNQGIFVFGNAPWVGEKHLLLGGHTVTNVETGYPFWQYEAHNHVQVSGGLAWFVTHEGNQGALISAVVPSPAALDAYEKGQADLVLKPGTVVKIDVSALPDKTEAAKVAKALEAQLARNGCTVGDQGTISLIAYSDQGKEVELGFVPAPPPQPKMKGPAKKGPAPPVPADKVRAATIREVFARLKFVSKGKDLWSASGDNVPKSVQLREGETLQEHLRSLEKPNYAFYDTVALPRLLLQSAGPTILGKTKVTISGVR